MATGSDLFEMSFVFFLVKTSFYIVMASDSCFFLLHMKMKNKI
jgi:hypothetical protein